MKIAKNIRLVLVTAPHLKSARRLASAALNARLVACANLLPAVESHYRWQGRLERAKEVLILFKTTHNRLSSLEKLVLSLHPYDTPEIVAITIDSSTPRYLQWILANTAPTRP